MIEKRFECCVCNRNLITADNKVGGAMTLIIGDDPVSQELYPDLKRGEAYVMCLACVLRGMRVRV